MATIVVVGGGMAAHRLCRQLVAKGALRRYRLIVFTDEASAPYDRVKLSDFFRTRNPADLLLDTPNWYRDHGIELRLGEAVTKLDPLQQLLHTARGAAIAYDHLVLATGSHPFVPSIDGIHQDDVFMYRTLEDLQAILQRSKSARRAAVIGGGLLGLEAARALLDLGLETTVVEMADYLMPRQLDPEGAAQDELRLSKRHLARFEHEGHLWPDTAQPISTWPDERLVCNCFKVTKGALVAAQHAGAISVEALAKATNASTLCGSCQPLLVELTGATPYTSTTPDQASRALKWTAVAALIAVVLLTTLPPLPIADSIQHWWHEVEAFRRLGMTKQTTGYILMGLTYIALGLSLRKRWSRFSFGAFRSWRTAHALLGLGTLLGLVAHTGLRFGSNLNFALMSVFVVLNLAGAFAGWVAALEGGGNGGLGQWARRWRPLVTFSHLLLFWPLPVLLAFHILAVYYY